MKLLEFLKEWHERDIAYKRETHQIGYIDDQIKLRCLKEELYRKTYAGRDSKDLETLVNAIDSITHSMECERRQWFINLSRDFVNFTVNLTVLLAIVNLLAIPICNNSQSRFCQQVRYAPNSIQRYFSEPKDHTVPPLNTQEYENWLEENR